VAIPIAQAQIDAANRLHVRCAQWSSTDRAFERLATGSPGWDRESCILKSAVINDLYSTRVFAIWRMAEHLTHVMANRPADEHDLAEAIASLPNAEGDAVERRHWSFASKVLHFFVDGDRYPICDSFCRIMVAYHLGLGGRVPDAGNPYRAFMANLERVRELSNIDASLRDLDRYMWLVGQYRDWLKKGDEAITNGELRGLFEDATVEVGRDTVPCPGKRRQSLCGALAGPRSLARRAELNEGRSPGHPPAAHQRCLGLAARSQALYLQPDLLAQTECSSLHASSATR